MIRPSTFMWLVTLLLLSGRLEAAAPKFVTSTVEDGQDDVDPGVTEIRVTFDQAMNQTSWSVVGGGPTFPEMIGKPRWADEKTIVIGVKLQPDHEYRLSLNSDTFHGFRSRSGEAAAPQPMAFKTRGAVEAGGGGAG